ncbi:hypothetical protein Ancab_007677 [Ancistrocladus abbreviatus]
MGYGDIPMAAQLSSQASFMAVPGAARSAVEVPCGRPEALSGRGQYVEHNNTFLSAAFCPVPHLDLDPRACAMLPHARPGDRYAGFLGSAIGLPSGHTKPRGGYAGADGTPGCGHVFGGLMSPTSPQGEFNNTCTQMVCDPGCGHVFGGLMPPTSPQGEFNITSTKMVCDNLSRGGAHFPLQLGLNEAEGEKEINLGKEAGPLAVKQCDPMPLLQIPLFLLHGCH